MRQGQSKANGPEGKNGLASVRAKNHKGVEGLTLADLSAKWRDVVYALEREGVNVTNPEHALEGALSIRYAEPCILAVPYSVVQQIHARPAIHMVRRARHGVPSCCRKVVV